jgi:hypothetical protein
LTRQYRVRTAQPQADGAISALVDGPGIGRGGICYYFETQEDMRLALERLNLMLTGNLGRIPGNPPPKPRCEGAVPHMAPAQRKPDQPLRLPEINQRSHA